jgi:hypothetical protein
MKAITIVPPNAVVFLFDPENRSVRVPDTMAGQIVASNDSCLAVGTQASVDGDVTILVTTAAAEADISRLHRVFSGRLDRRGK